MVKLWDEADATVSMEEMKLPSSALLEPSVIRWSVCEIPKCWDDRGRPPEGEVRTAKSPFNMEAILRACPELYEAWRARPFIFVFDDDDIVTRYIDPTED